jgi:hypothetical protein
MSARRIGGRPYIRNRQRRMNDISIPCKRAAPRLKYLGHFIAVGMDGFPDLMGRLQGSIPAHPSLYPGMIPSAANGGAPMGDVSITVTSWWTAINEDDVSINVSTKN